MRKWISLFVLYGILVSPLKAKEGLGYFLVGEAFQGLTLYSWLVPAGLNLEDKAAVGVGLLTPMVWTGVSYANTLLSEKISSGMVLASLYGGWNGALQGLFMGDSTNRGTFALLMSTAENFGNYHLFNALNLNAVSAQRWWNFAGLGLFDFGIIDEFKSNNAIYGVVPLLTSYGSIPIFMNDEKATWGDAFFEMVSSSTVLGSVWLISLGVDESALDNRTFRVATGVGLSTLGYSIGYYLGRNRDISTGGAIFTLLVPSLVNMMVTGSIVLLSGSGEAALISSGILIPLGVYGSYFLFSKKSDLPESRKMGRLNFMLNPYAGALTLFKGSKVNNVSLGMITYSF